MSLYCHKGKCVLYIKFKNLRIFKKLKASYHNLFLLGKRKPAMYSTLQEDCKIQFMAIFLKFCANGPNVEISSKPSPPQREVWDFKLIFNNILLTILHFQSDCTEHRKVNKTKFLWTFLILGQLAQIRNLFPSSHKMGKIFILFL